ncbi:hypothetical protein Dimus_025403 [Dionaea muscipula]
MWQKSKPPTVYEADKIIHLLNLLRLLLGICMDDCRITGSKRCYKLINMSIYQNIKTVCEPVKPSLLGKSIYQSIFCKIHESKQKHQTPLAARGTKKTSIP